MRHDRIAIDDASEINVRQIIAAGLAVRALERTNPQGVSSSDFTLALGDAYRGWAATLIDTILDYAERDRRVARRFRSWRRRKAQRAEAFWRAAMRLAVLRGPRTPRRAIAARDIAAFLPAPPS